MIELERFGDEIAEHHFGVLAAVGAQRLQQLDFAGQRGHIGIAVDQLPSTCEYQTVLTKGTKQKVERIKKRRTLNKFVVLDVLLYFHPLELELPGERGN